MTVIDREILNSDSKLNLDLLLASYGSPLVSFPMFIGINNAEDHGVFATGCNFTLRDRDGNETYVPLYVALTQEGILLRYLPHNKQKVLVCYDRDKLISE